MSNIVHSQGSDPAVEPVLAHVAGNLRAFRTAAGLSQAEVAARAGLSRRTIVGLEGGDTSISLARLARVAEALGVSFARLVREPDPGDRPAARATVWRGSRPESRAALLGAAAAMREVEFWSWSLAPGERYQAEPDPPGWREAIHVLDGTLVLERPGGPETLGPGAFTLFASDASYAYANPGPDVVRFTRTVLA